MVKTYHYRKRCMMCDVVFSCYNGNRQVCDECRNRRGGEV